MAEYYRSMDQWKAQDKAFRLSIANTEGWERYSDYHFSRTFNDKLAYWWPSTGTLIYNGKRYYGHTRSILKLRELYYQESENKNE